MSVKKFIKLDLTKTFIPDPHILLQKILFELGFRWNSGDKKLKENSFKYLYINDSLTCNSCSYQEFIESEETYECVDDFIAEHQFDNVKKIITDHYTKHQKLSFPEKWCIKITDENIDDLNSYRSHGRSVYAPFDSHDKGNFMDASGFLYIKNNKVLKSFTEITYDQFKEHVLGCLFALPNRWFIRVTKENRSILEEWKGSKLVTLRSDSILLSNENWAAVSNAVLSRHVEITLDQFKKHVLKESSEEKLFELPKKWSVKVNKDSSPGHVCIWRGISWADEGYINYKGNWGQSLHEDCIEITFDQFVNHIYKPWKETNPDYFILPTNWYIKITEENKEELQKYRSSGGRSFGTFTFKSVYMEDNGSSHASTSEKIKYMTEITYDQFKEYVLNKGSEVSEIKKDDLVVALTNMSDPMYATCKITKGMQYRVKDIQGSKQFVEVYGINAYWPIENFQLFETQFTLPSKWCIKQHHEVAMYMNMLEGWSGWSEDLELFSHFPKANKSGSTEDDGDNKYCHREIRPGYTEITLGQFREHVLMQSFEQSKPARKWDIGDVVKRIRTHYEDALIGGQAYSISHIIMTPNSVEIQIEGSDLLWDAKFFTFNHRPEKKAKETTKPFDEWEVGDIIIHSKSTSQHEITWIDKKENSLRLAGLAGVYKFLGNALTFSHRPEKKQPIPVSEWKSGDVIIRKWVPDDLLKSGQEYTIDQVTHQTLDGRIMVTLLGKGFKWNAETFDFGHRPEKRQPIPFLATSTWNCESNSDKQEKEDEILFHPINDFDTICSATVTTGKKIEIERQYQSIVKK